MAGAPKATPQNACGDLFTTKEQLIRFVLKLLKRDLSAGVGLQMCVELIVLLQTVCEGRVCQNTGAEFLKMHTYPVERKTASAVGTFNSSHVSREYLLNERARPTYAERRPGVSFFFVLFGV